MSNKRQQPDKRALSSVERLILLALPSLALALT